MPRSWQRFYRVATLPQYTPNMQTCQTCNVPLPACEHWTRSMGSAKPCRCVFACDQGPRRARKPVRVQRTNSDDHEAHAVSPDDASAVEKDGPLTETSPAAAAPVLAAEPAESAPASSPPKPKLRGVRGICRALGDCHGATSSCTSAAQALARFRKATHQRSKQPLLTLPCPSPRRQGASAAAGQLAGRGALRWRRCR